MLFLPALPSHRRRRNIPIPICLPAHPSHSSFAEVSLAPGVATSKGSFIPREIPASLLLELVFRPRVGRDIASSPPCSLLQAPPSPRSSFLPLLLVFFLVLSPFRVLVRARFIPERDPIRHDTETSAGSQLQDYPTDPFRLDAVLRIPFPSECAHRASKIGHVPLWRSETSGQAGECDTRCDFAG